MKLLGIAGAICVAAVALSNVLTAPAQAQQGADAAKGEILFKQRCASCHAVGGKGGKIGPELTRVMGRKAGNAAYAYSTAMKDSKIVWSSKTLDAYLAAPTKTLPGTKMVISVTKPEDRAAIISYLAKGG